MPHLATGRLFSTPAKPPAILGRSRVQQVTLKVGSIPKFKGREDPASLSLCQFSFKRAEHSKVGIRWSIVSMNPF